MYDNPNATHFVVMGHFLKKLVDVSLIRYQILLIQL